MFGSSKRKRILLIVSFQIASLLLFVAGIHGLTWRSAQIEYYNLAIMKYMTAVSPDDLKVTMDDFNKSVAAFEEQRKEAEANWWIRFLYPIPSARYAADADFHIGMCYAHLKKLVPACKECLLQAKKYWEESQRYNPGNRLPESLSRDEAEQWFEESLVDKKDWYKLLDQHPELGNKSRRGNEKRRNQGDDPGQGGDMLPGIAPSKESPRTL